MSRIPALSFYSRHSGWTNRTQNLDLPGFTTLFTDSVINCKNIPLSATYVLSTGAVEWNVAWFSLSPKFVSRIPQKPPAGKGKKRVSSTSAERPRSTVASAIIYIYIYTYVVPLWIGLAVVSLLTQVLSSSVFRPNFYSKVVRGVN